MGHSVPHSSVGALRRRLLLETPVPAADGLGGTTLDFIVVAALWGRIEWLRGDEHWRAGGHEQSATHRVTLRWRAGVDAGQRLRDGERILAIRTVADPDGDRRRLVCLVEERGP